MTLVNSRMLVDTALSRRLERAEGRSGADFVNARAHLSPEVGAVWREVGGALVLFDGPGSPVTQTFGLGMSEPVTPALMDEIERFFSERSAPVYHEVSPLADDSALHELCSRGYRPIEFTAVLFQELGPAVRAAKAAADVTARLALAEDVPAWIEASVQGWGDFPEYAGEMRELARISAARTDARIFVAELDGKLIATGALAPVEGVAILAGASTIPAARGRGAQLALLDARLRLAVELGCDVAMMCARPGGASQRNAERNGFRIAYTRIKWGRATNS